MWGWMGSGSRISEGGSSIMVMAALPCCLTLQALLPSERRAHMHTRMHTHMRCCSNTPQPSRFAAAAAAAACLLLLLLFQAPPPRTAATAFLSGPSAAPPRRCLVISSSPSLPLAPFFLPWRTFLSVCVVFEVSRSQLEIQAEHYCMRILLLLLLCIDTCSTI